MNGVTQLVFISLIIHQSLIIFSLLGINIRGSVDSLCRDGTDMPICNEDTLNNGTTACACV